MMSEKDTKDIGVKPKADDPLAALTPEARKIFEETQSGLLSALQKEREANSKNASKIELIEKENQKRLEAQLTEQGKYKDLAEERAQQLAKAQAKAEKVEAYQEVLSKHLTAQIEEIPEDMRSLIPSSLPVEDQLDWIAVNRAKLVKPLAQKIGAGERGGSQEKSVDLTDEERAIARKFNMTDEEYAKNKN